jgi:hypothetical protein
MPPRDSRSCGKNDRVGKHRMRAHNNKHVIRPGFPLLLARAWIASRHPWARRLGAAPAGIAFVKAPLRSLVSAHLVTDPKLLNWPWGSPFYRMRGYFYTHV